MPGVCCECVTFSFTVSPLICSLTVTLLLHEIIYLSLFISAEHGTLYFETSAKTGFGIEEAFDAIAVATQEKMMARARELKCASDEVSSLYLSLS